MIVSVNDQALTFLLTVLSGCLIGLTYDLLRILRRIIRHNNLLINIEDLLYFILCGLLIFFILFNKNYGQIRGFSLLGALLGVIIYFFTLSPTMVEYGTRIIKTIIRIITTLITLITKPIILLLSIIIYPFKFLYNVSKKFYQPKLTKSKKWVKIKGKGIKRTLKVIFKKI